MDRSAIITIGATAGHHFHGQADLQVAKHAERTTADGKVESGFFMVRKRLVDRAAFNYDPCLGWEIDRWFEWNKP